MNLKIRAGEPGQRAFERGYAARVWVNDVEVSQSISRVLLIADASGGPISAEITFLPTHVDVETPAVITPPIEQTFDPLVISRKLVAAWKASFSRAG